MGRLYYGAALEPITIDDRSLAHVRVVVTTKLRRNESFAFTLPRTDSNPEGRSTLWLSPSIPLRFEYDGAEPEDLDRALLAHLAESANSSGGMLLEEEL